MEPVETAVAGGLALATAMPPKPSPVAQALRTSFYRPELDSLRFFAFFLVFLCHAIKSGPGWLGTLRASASLGVCLFFALSAYLICELLEREKRRFGDIDLRSFYARRILRIWPLYFAMLIADFTLERMLHPGAFSVSRLLAYFFLAGNFYAAIHSFTMSISTPLWSISIEEQFYLIWPTVRKLLSGKALIGLSAFVYLQSMATLWYLGRSPGIDKNSVWVNSFVQFQYFAGGCLLGLLLRGRVPKYSAWLRLLVVGLGLAAMFSAQQFFHFKDDAVPVSSASLIAAYLLGNVACLLFFLGFLGEERLGWRPLVYLGKISYGLYVFHWAMIRVVAQAMTHLPLGALSADAQSLLRVVVGLPLAVAAASLSYRFFEAPILRYKRRFERVKTRPV